MTKMTPFEEAMSILAKAQQVMADAKKMKE